MNRVIVVLITLTLLLLVSCSNSSEDYVLYKNGPQEQSLFNEQEEVINEVNYIGNANSYKFHEIDCPSVDQMKDSNKVFLVSRQEAIDKGFKPCKRCNP